MLTRDEIGRRAARELGAGMVVDLGTPMGVHLGIGMPAPAATSIRPELVEVALQVGTRLRAADAGAEPAPAIEGGRV